MELKDERIIPASLEATWAALNNPEILKDCIAGCESLERTGDDSYLAVVAVKIGPVSARFKGQMHLSDIEPPYRYTIHFDGKGGVAGFGKGSADVSLSDADGQTRLSYQARAQVGGKLAQIGSRLVDAAAAKLSEDFFKCFEHRLMRGEPGVEIDATPLQNESPLPLSSVRTEQKGLSTFKWGAVCVAAVVIAGYFYFR